MEEIFHVDNNVIILGFDVIQKYKTVNFAKKIDEMYPKERWEADPDLQEEYETLNLDAEKYVVMYIEGIENQPITLSYMENKVVLNKIQCSFVVLKYGNIGEIHVISKSPGTSDAYLVATIETFLNYSNKMGIKLVWTAMKLNSSDLLKQTDVFSLVGFKNPLVTRSTPNGYLYKNDMIALYWNKDIYNDEKYREYKEKGELTEKDIILLTRFKRNGFKILTRTQVETLQKLYIDNKKNKNSGTFTYEIKRKALEKIYTFMMDRKYETSGVFYIGALEENYKGMKIAKLGFPEDAGYLNVGTATQVMTVLESNTRYFIWHTHPFVSIEKWNFFLLWPSSDDIYVSFSRIAHGNSIYHIVSTPEGIYNLGFGIDFLRLYQIWLDKLENDKKYLLQSFLLLLGLIVREKFLVLELFRIADVALEMKSDLIAIEQISKDPAYLESYRNVDEKLRLGKANKRYTDEFIKIVVEILFTNIMNTYTIENLRADYPKFLPKIENSMNYQKYTEEQKKFIYEAIPVADQFFEFAKQFSNSLVFDYKFISWDYIRASNGLKFQGYLPLNVYNNIVLDTPLIEKNKKFTY